MIPRKIKATSTNITLHGFGYTSENAYAAVIYAVQSHTNGNLKVTILVANSKVTHLKHVSINGLELKGALLLARLHSSVSEVLAEYTIAFLAYIDSQVVLSWLSSPLTNWKPSAAKQNCRNPGITSFI